MKNEFFNSHIYPTGDIWKDRVESGSITFYLKNNYNVFVKKIGSK